jgi:hypothetical protein
VLAVGNVLALMPLGLDGTVPLDGIQECTDDEIVARLSNVRGIGRWTAQMFLTCVRPDGLCRPPCSPFT